MRVDLHVVAVGCDRCGGAHIDTLVAADLRGAAVRADLLVVGEELRLLELPDHLRELRCRERLLERVAARRQVSLRRLRGLEYPLARQIEHHVEALAALAPGAAEVDGADRAAGL